MKIGVFDSGMGGLSVANAIKRALPEHEVIFKNDAKHVPYGARPMDEVLSFVLPILQSLIDDKVNCIVVACNTVTTNLLPQLESLLDVPLIGMEPLLEQAAAMTKSGVIAVCATPATLNSDRYAWLKQAYAKNVEVLEPDCGDWAGMIEQDRIDRDKIAYQMQQAIKSEADIIVLGCTHYHWIEEEIYHVVNGLATVLQPEPYVIKHLKQVLARRP